MNSFVSPETFAFLSGGLSVLASIVVALILRRAVRGVSAASSADALRVAAERRARDAEDRLRLAELEIARSGGTQPEAAKRVNVRPVR